jgi:predicted nucleic acid-binding protein
MLKVLCDTDTLFHNIERHKEHKKSRQELEALRSLWTLRESGKIFLFRSRVVRAELEGASKNRDRLQADYESLDPIPKDENVVGFQHLTDHLGGTVSSYPLVSDILDEPIYKELTEQRRLRARDAHHITHAIGNNCDVFLTRDERTIMKPHREWLEHRFPGLRIRRPTELIEEIGVEILAASNQM